ncbi:MAG: glycosyltransferase [Dehalococcoidia bacterium]|nr:glycosyltransferase [Dehalococcoidia bacterium]
MRKRTETATLPDGTVYSQRKGFCPFSVPSLEAYAPIIGEHRMERLQVAAGRLKGLRLLELNSSAQGGGVAEMLYRSVPFLNSLGIEAEWKIVHGKPEYFETTKRLHNMLQGKKGFLTPDMERVYLATLDECSRANIIDCEPDVVIANDPQPMGLIQCGGRNNASWIWRCHIDIEEGALAANPSLWSFISSLVEPYDAAIFSAAHYVVSRWPLPKFTIPPFIDPLSEKNKELSRREIDKVLDKYQIESAIPIVAQIGRFDPWKGLDRTVKAFRLARKERVCQLVIAGGLAADDPEGKRILEELLENTKNDRDIHVLQLSLSDRLQNYIEVNALQRSASIIMQPSTREGFGLVITEALWKRKPVVASDVGAIPLQIVDGHTGYFYETPKKTADKLVHLLDNPKAATAMGERGQMYVSEHFLLPDRIADYLMAVGMTLHLAKHKWMPKESIVSFHPWTKLGKRRWQGEV